MAKEIRKDVNAQKDVAKVTYTLMFVTLVDSSTGKTVH